MGKSASLSLPPYSVEKSALCCDGYSPTFISPIAHNGLVCLKNNASTMYESFIFTVQKYPNNPFLGTREVSASGQLGGYLWKSYQEIYSLSQSLSSGLRRLKLFTASNKPIALWSKNREELIIMETSCISQNITMLPLSDTLTADALSLILEEVRPSVIACGKAQYDLLITLKPESLASIKDVVCFDCLREAVKLDCKRYGFELHEFKEIIDLSTPKIPDNPPNPEDIYCITYTSGSSGNPKGVMLSHRNMISSILSIALNNYDFTSKDSYLMYLPHSHIYDRIMCAMLISFGCRLGFYSGDILNIRDDLKHLQPTIFVSVPRLFNRIYEIILQKFSEKTGLSRIILRSSLKSKKKKYETIGSVSNGMFESIAFKKVRKSLGGHVRLMISASAPMSSEVLKFLKMVFSCVFAEAYGLTETSGPCFITNPNDKLTGHIGGPVPGVEVRLREIPEMGYYVNTENPSGELCIRAPSVFRGYFGDQIATDNAVDSDGWLYTGDVLTRSAENGYFRVIDRISNIIKLSQGEYVSIDKVESAIIKSRFIKQVFVYGDPFRHYLVAVVVPCKEYVLGNWGKKNNNIYNSEDNWGNVVRSPKLKNDLFENLKEVCLKSMLSKSELVMKIFLEEQEWTDQDLLTHTLKINRKKAKEKYLDVIQSLYSENN